MLMPLESLVKSYGLQRGAVLHVGAHLAEEAGDYHRLGFRPVWWIEANPDVIDVLRLKLLARELRRDNVVIEAAVAESEREVTLHVASNGQSSSILQLGTHATQHPEVTYVKEIVLQTTTVDHLFDKGRIGQADFVNIDVQGAELDVLRGAEAYIGGVSALYLEVNEDELYKGCALLPEVERWLDERGFGMIEKRMTPHGWGDALFLARSHPWWIK